MLVAKEMRNLKFSSSKDVVTVVAEATNYGFIFYYFIGGRPFNLPNGLTMASRQGIIDHIKKNFRLDNKVKVIYEDYCCQICVQEKKITLDLKAVPRSEKYTDIIVMANSVQIFKGKEKITFNSIRGMQDLALSKLSECEKQKGMSQSNISKPVTMQKKADTIQQKPDVLKKEASKPNGVLVSSFKEGYAEGVAQRQKQNKTTEAITKFSKNDTKKPNTLYRNLGISDEAAARGNMSPTNYILEGLFGKTPEGVKPAKNMTEIIQRKG